MHVAVELAFETVNDELVVVFELARDEVVPNDLGRFQNVALFEKGFVLDLPQLLNYFFAIWAVQ
jgi:hypothetical protein